MRRLLAPILVALLLPAFVSSCRSIPPPAGLGIELAGLERAPDGAVTATLRLVNASVVAFNIGHSTHQLFLNGQPAGTIVVNEPVGLPAQHTLTESAPLKRAGGALPSGEVSYQLDSELTLLLYGDHKEMQKLSYAGTVTLP